MWEAYALLLLGAACWFWYDSMRARERAAETGRSACARAGLQFLDDTVALETIWPGRDSLGRLRWRRRYAFEFSDPLVDAGDNRRDGVVIMLSDKVELLEMAPVRMQ